MTDKGTIPFSGYLIVEGKSAGSYVDAKEEW